LLAVMMCWQFVGRIAVARWTRQFHRIRLGCGQSVGGVNGVAQRVQVGGVDEAVLGAGDVDQRSGWSLVVCSMDWQFVGRIAVARLTRQVTSQRPVGVASIHPS
jgi:hypothetical protein